MCYSLPLSLFPLNFLFVEYCTYCINPLCLLNFQPFFSPFSYLCEQRSQFYFQTFESFVSIIMFLFNWKKLLTSWNFTEFQLLLYEWNKISHISMNMRHYFFSITSPINIHWISFRALCVTPVEYISKLPFLRYLNEESLQFGTLASTVESHPS